MARRCDGITRAGHQCRRDAIIGEAYCPHHTESAVQERERKKLDVIAALREKFGYAVAAEMAGITWQTLKWWRDEDPDFAQACHEARHAALDRVESALLDRAIGFVGPDKRFVWSDKAASMLLAGERAQYRTGYEASVDRPVDPVEQQARKVFEDPDAADEIERILAALEDE